MEDKIYNKVSKILEALEYERKRMQDKYEDPDLGDTSSYGCLAKSVAYENAIKIIGKHLGCSVKGDYMVEDGITPRDENKKTIRNKDNEIIGIVIEDKHELSKCKDFIQYFPFWHNTLRGQNSYYQLGGVCDTWDECIERIIKQYENDKRA